MKNGRRLAGRFHAWRVYARWLWAVRIGLVTLPLVLLLSGGIRWYLTAPEYRSTVTFEYTGERSLEAAAKLLKSGVVVDAALKGLDAADKFAVSRESIVELVTPQLVVTPDFVTNTLTLSVTDFHAQTARDIAAALPAALDRHEKLMASAMIENRISQQESAVFAAEELAETARLDLARLLEIRGAGAGEGEGISRLDFDEARAGWEHAQADLLDARSSLAASRRQIRHIPSHVIIVSQPFISHIPVARKWSGSLGDIFLQAICGGLAFALIIPYLLELAFPRRRVVKDSPQASPYGPAWLESEA